MIEQLKARLADIEKAMIEVAGNHTALQVRKDECTYLLGLAEKVAEAVAPTSVVTEVIEAVEAVEAVQQSAC